MSDRIKWLSDGVSVEGISQLSSSEISVLATDDPGGDTCSTYGGCSLYSCMSNSPCSDSPSCSSDSATCATDSDDGGKVSLEAKNITQTGVTLISSGAGTPSVTRYWYFKITLGSTLIATRYRSNMDTSMEYTFSNLTPGTEYYAQCRYGKELEALRDWANYGTIGNTYPGGSCYFTTKEAYATSDSATLSYDVDYTSVTLKLTNITPRNYSRTVWFHWENSSTGNSGTPTLTLAAGETSISRVMPNLTSDTGYVFQVYITNPDGDRTYTSSREIIRTLSYNYTLTASSFGTSSTVGVTITVNEVKSFDIPIRVRLNGARELDATISAGSSSRQRTWVTDITPATVYTITIYDDKRDKTFTLTRRTKNNFSWSTNVSSGVEFNLLATDWNEFTSQLKAKAAYYGREYNPATVNKGDSLTAEKFNNIVAVINWMVDNNKGDCVTRLSSTSKGKPVTAAVINSLASCLNE